ncbi:MAG: hypothetical protein AAFR58_20580 [Cyanobacteria bacterium J06627_28]
MNRTSFRAFPRFLVLSGLECCMTMSGPAQKARSEDITLEITQ